METYQLTRQVLPVAVLSIISTDQYAHERKNEDTTTKNAQAVRTRAHSHRHKCTLNPIHRPHALRPPVPATMRLLTYLLTYLPTDLPPYSLTYLLNLGAILAEHLVARLRAFPAP